MLQNKKVLSFQEEFIFNVPSFRDKCSKSQKLSDLPKTNREITRNLVLLLCIGGSLKAATQ